MNTQDKLDSIFELQAMLNRKIGIDPLSQSFTEEQKSEWVLNYSRAMSQEIAEMIDSLPWKWWAKYQKFDEQNIKVELVDILHFLVSACQVMGMTSEDLYRIYSEKHKVNVSRQDKGYHEKIHDDAAHIH